MTSLGAAPDYSSTYSFPQKLSIYYLLLARLTGQYCFARWRLSSFVVVVCNAAAKRERSGNRHFTADQYGYVRLGRHLVKYRAIVVEMCTTIF